MGGRRRRHVQIEILFFRSLVIVRFYVCTVKRSDNEVLGDTDIRMISGAFQYARQEAREDSLSVLECLFRELE
jgi:hypothetical protein